MQTCSWPCISYVKRSELFLGDVRRGDDVALWVYQGMGSHGSKATREAKVESKASFTRKGKIGYLRYIYFYPIYIIRA